VNPGRLSRGALIAALVAIVTRAAPAQVPVRDTAAVRDTAPADSAPPPEMIRLMPVETAPGPLPPGSRLVFSRDSLLWISGYTLADVLAEVPGVFVARTGFVGQPAMAFYGNRGVVALELYRDGVPVLPLGPDSVAMDPGRISLIGLRQVEVERLPGLLRVYLISERNARIGSRSLVRVISGDFKSGGYAGVFQHRWASGLGIDLSADHFDTQGDRIPQQRNALWFNLGARADWTPTPRLAATVDIRRLGFSRDPTTHEAGGILPGREETRTEALVRFVAAQRPERQGLALELGLQTSSWSADSGSADSLLPTHTVHRAFAGLGLRGQAGTIEVRATAADHYTPLAVSGRVAWMPWSHVVLAGDGRWERHPGERTSARARGTLGFFGGPFSLVGDVVAADAVPAPMLPADTARQTLDLGGRLGFVTRHLAFHGGVERRDAFDPPPMPSLPPFARLPATGTATYAVADLMVKVAGWSLSGWISHPVQGDTAPYTPPTHSRIALTLRSKFWRTFRSGAFDIKAQIAIESWGSGVAGVDPDGFAQTIPGATIAEAFLQIQLVQFRAFYSLRNALRTEDWYVPGFTLFRVLQTFGVKWDFQN
jgi:hypothetical protein